MPVIQCAAFTIPSLQQSLSCRSSQDAPPPYFSNPPTNSKLLQVLIAGTGAVQDYVCIPQWKNNLLSFSIKHDGARARDLLDKSGLPSGIRHYFKKGPTVNDPIIPVFQASDGGIIELRVIHKDDAPNRDKDIPWIELEVVRYTGPQNGILSQVKKVRRILTIGGKSSSASEYPQAYRNFELPIEPNMTPTISVNYAGTHYEFYGNNTLN